MNGQLVQRIKDCSALPSMPAIALQVLELAQQEDCDIAELAKVIAKDAALAGKILRTVNSSFYARAQKVATISHAMVILGIQSVKTLVLGFSLTSSLTSRKSIGFKHVDYWRRSIYAATAARTIAARVAEVQGEECFLAALLMDIGMLVLDQVVGEEYGRVIANAGSHANLPKAEEAALGLNHAQVSQLVVETWKLPPVLAVPVTNHHAPDAVQDPALQVLTNVVALASRCADVFVDADAAGAIAETRKAMAALHGMSEAEADKLMKEIEERTREVAPLFEIALGPTTFESILKKANEALVELTLNSQRQADAFKAKANSLEARAANLKEQNQKLKVQAAVDGLTGLANRATFNLFLEKVFELSVKTNRPLALVMLDLDKFKSINDAHGHPAGDAVIRAAAQALKAAAGKGQLVARFGGEELALVAPNLGRGQAAALAEQVRQSLAAQPVRHGRADIAYTASFGVAAYDPAASPFKDVAQLVKAADLSLYAAKQAGRNCVKVFGTRQAAERPAA